MQQYNYSREEITQLILRDLESRLGLDLSETDVPVFVNQEGRYTLSIPEEISDVSSNNENTVELTRTEPDWSSMIESEPVTETSSLPEPPVPESDYEAGILELLEWAIEHNRMVQIVYLKRTGGGFERSGRVITPLSMEDDRIRTILHVTIRDSNDPEYTTAEDNRRTFITGLIEKASIIDRI